MKGASPPPGMTADVTPYTNIIIDDFWQLPLAGMCIGCTSPVPAFFRASFLLQYRVARYFPLPFFGVAPCDLPATCPRKSPERLPPCRASFFKLTVFSWVFSFAMPVAFRCCVCVVFPGKPSDAAPFPSRRCCVSLLSHGTTDLVGWLISLTFFQLIPCERLPAPFAAVFLSMSPQGSHTRTIGALTAFQIDFPVLSFPCLIFPRFAPLRALWGDFYRQG